MTTRKGKNRLRRAGRGSVTVIAGLLVTSAAIRLASGVALAEDDAQSVASLPALVESRPLAAASNDAQPGASRAEMASLLDSLRQREAALAEKEEQIERRKMALEAADAEIMNRLAALEQAEAALRETLSLADGAAENDISRLTAVYESMKAKDAAALFETMDPGFAAGFLGRMRPDAAAAIMAGLSPEVAYSISVILAGRNTGAPKT
ncbi:MAG: hypothetical protein AAF744_01735 [Pseudomonadota bacterium]